MSVLESWNDWDTTAERTRLSASSSDLDSFESKSRSKVAERPVTTYAQLTYAAPIALTDRPAEASSAKSNLRPRLILPISQGSGRTTADPKTRNQYGGIARRRAIQTRETGLSNCRSHRVAALPADDRQRCTGGVRSSVSHSAPHPGSYPQKIHRFWFLTLYTP